MPWICGVVVVGVPLGPPSPLFSSSGPSFEASLLEGLGMFGWAITATGMLEGRFDRFKGKGIPF